MSLNLNDVARNINGDCDKAIIVDEGLELSKFHIDKLTVMSLLAGKIMSFFDLDPHDCMFHADSIELVLDDIGVKFNVDYKDYNQEFFVTTVVEMFDPACVTKSQSLSKEWIIVLTNSIDSITGSHKSVFVNLQTTLNENDLIKTMIAVRDLVERQQKAKNLYYELYYRAVSDMRFRIQVLIAGALGGVGAMCVAEDTKELVGLLTVMGVSSFLAILLKDKLSD